MPISGFGGTLKAHPNLRMKFVKIDELFEDDYLQQPVLEWMFYCQDRKIQSHDEIRVYK